MHRLATALALLIGLAVLPSQPLYAQAGWLFLQEATVGFAEADSMASPYLGTLDADGNLWVISSSEERVYTNLAINALYRARPGERTFTRVFDFTDAGVRSTTGITAVGNDIFVSTRLRNPANAVDPYWPYTAIFRFLGGSTEGMQFFSDETHSDYGSWFTGIAATEDGLIFAGRSWQPTIAVYDFRPGSATYGNTIGIAGDNSVPLDPFGALEPNGTSYIRAVALIPGADYGDPATPVYTSRNASMFEGTAPAVGGVAAWSGGVQTDPTGYRAERLFEPGGTVDFGPRHPNGIALDHNGRLYVANSTDRWAKVFTLVGPMALELHDLPSATTERPGEQHPDGAPFEEPSDVVLDGVNRTAWVLDRRAQAAFHFAAVFTSNEPAAEPGPGFRLEQSFPNPATASALIGFHLDEPTAVRLTLYDVLGRLVATLADDVYPAGGHHASFDAAGLPSGIYLYRLDTPQGSASHTMTLLK
jgi:hypothetical protein